MQQQQQQQPSSSLSMPYPAGMSLAYSDFYLSALAPSQPPPPPPPQPSASSFGLGPHVFSAPTLQLPAQPQAQAPAPRSAALGSSPAALFTHSPHLPGTSPATAPATAPAAAKSPASLASAHLSHLPTRDRDELHFFLHGHSLPLGADPNRSANATSTAATTTTATTSTTTATAIPSPSQPQNGALGESGETRAKHRGKHAKPIKCNPHFVSKLFFMLEDGSYGDVVRWSYTRDSFIVVNMDKFTKDVLPQHFKHSNFSSFVRQLNKYDFHKLKKDPSLLEKLFHIEPGQARRDMFDQMWEFKHESFRAGRPDLLASVRRKVTTAAVPANAAGKKPGASTLSGTEESGVERAASAEATSEISDLRQQITDLQAIQDGLSKHISTLTKQYESVLVDMANVQEKLVHQDKLMQRLVRSVSASGSGSGHTPPTVTATPLSLNAVRLSSPEQSPTLSFRSDAAAGTKSKSIDFTAPEGDVLPCSSQAPLLEQPQEQDLATLSLDLDLADTPGTVTSDSASEVPSGEDEPLKDDWAEPHYLSMLSFSASIPSPGRTSPLKRPANDAETEPTTKRGRAQT